MTLLGDQIRRASAAGELDPLVRDNLASPRGLCNCSHRTHGAILFCTLDYGHPDDVHLNGSYTWRGPWPAAPKIILDRLRQLELLDGNASAAETRELVRVYRLAVYGIDLPAAEPEPLERQAERLCYWHYPATPVER